MPSPIRADMVGRTPAPESFEGRIGSRWEMAVRATGGPPASCLSTWSTELKAPRGTASLGSLARTSCLASSFAP